MPFEDNLHILFINGEYRGEDSLGVLMHDFSCPNPDDMKYEELAQKVRYYKQETEGVKTMCKAFEDLSEIIATEKAAIKVAERNVEFAKKMIQKGNYSIEEICELSGLSKETVEQLTEKLKSSVTVQ